MFLTFFQIVKMVPNFANITYQNRDRDDRLAQNKLICVIVLSLLITLNISSHWCSVFIVDFEDVFPDVNLQYSRYDVILIQLRCHIWVNICQNGPSEICGRGPLKNLKWYGPRSSQYHFKILKGCLPQILPSSFLSTLTHRLMLNIFIAIFSIII